MSPESTIDVRREHGILQILVSDQELVGDDRIDQFVEEVARWVDGETAPRIVLDLSRLQTVTSYLLGALVGIRNRVRSRHGQLRLAAVGPKIEQLLVVTHLVTLFEIHPTREQAAASLG